MKNRISIQHKLQSDLNCRLQVFSGSNLSGAEPRRAFLAFPPRAARACTWGTRRWCRRGHPARSRRARGRPEAEIYKFETLSKVGSTC